MRRRSFSSFCASRAVCSEALIWHCLSISSRCFFLQFRSALEKVLAGLPATHVQHTQRDRYPFGETLAKLRQFLSVAVLASSVPMLR